MRRALAVLAGVFGVIACGSFGTDEISSSDGTEDAGDEGDKPSRAKDGGTITSEGGQTCTDVMNQPFSSTVHVGWDRKIGGSAALMAGDNAPDGTPALHAQATPAEGEMAAAVLERSIDLPSFTSATAAFDFRYSVLEPTASIGCSFGLTRKAPAAQIRIGIALESTMTTLRFYLVEGAPVSELTEHLPIAQPPAEGWTRVRLEIRLSADGWLEQTTTVGGGEPTVFTRFQPPGELAGFDGVLLDCGIVSATGTGGGSTDDVYIKDLTVTTCP